MKERGGERGMVVVVVVVGGGSGSAGWRDEGR